MFILGVYLGEIREVGISSCNIRDSKAPVNYCLKENVVKQPDICEGLLYFYEIIRAVLHTQIGYRSKPLEKFH